MSKYNTNTHQQQPVLATWPLTKNQTKTAPNLINKLGQSHTVQHDAKISLLREGDEKRPQVEAFIKDVFKKHHGAKLEHFAPSLLATFNQQKEVDAALGYRLAHEGPLFLETYLDQSIESLVSQYLGEKVERHSIGETGNLASANAASCKELFSYTADYLNQQGIEWFVSTGTAVMRVVYRRLGIKAHIIHDVEKSRLGKGQDDWGSFYEDKPKIILINVAQAKQRFNELTAKLDANNPH